MTLGYIKVPPTLSSIRITVCVYNMCVCTTFTYVCAQFCVCILAIGLRCYVHVRVVCVQVYSTYFCVVAMLFFGLSVCANVPAGAPVSVIS